MCFKQYKWRHLLKIDIATNYTGPKFWGNYEKRLKTDSNTEYSVICFATILSFCLLKNWLNFSGGNANFLFTAQTQTSISFWQHIQIHWKYIQMKAR
jgi:hypothetical protein